MFRRSIVAPDLGTRLMCGICSSTDDSRRTRVARMTAAMVARGPDDDGVYADRFSGVSLGARRLSIIDVANGRQPLKNERRTLPLFYAEHAGDLLFACELNVLVAGRERELSSIRSPSTHLRLRVPPGASIDRAGGEPAAAGLPPSHQDVLDATASERYALPTYDPIIARRPRGGLARRS